MVTRDHVVVRMPRAAHPDTGAAGPVGPVHAFELPANLGSIQRIALVHRVVQAVQDGRIPA